MSVNLNRNYVRRSKKLAAKLVLASIILTSLLSTLPSMFIGVVSAPDPWFNVSWGYRKSVTVDYTKVAGDLTNFPVLVDIVDSDLASRAQADGDDILFTSAAGAQLDHEIEYFDSATGHLVAWVGVPLVSSSVDTLLYMYYGNASVGNQESPAMVWGPDYHLVQHLEEISGIHNDSSGAMNDGAIRWGVDRNVTGIIDGADEFDGLNSTVKFNHSESITGFQNSFTFSAWFKTENLTKRQAIATKYLPTDDQRAWQIDFQHNVSTYNEDVIGFYVSSNGTVEGRTIWYGNFSTVTGGWQYLAVVWEADKLPIFYVNDTVLPLLNVTGGTAPGIYNNNNTALFVGWNSFETLRAFDGEIDEVRISNVTRSQDWVSTQYNNQVSPGTFITLGSESSGNLYYITASAGSGGSITPVGAVAVDESSSKMFKIVPDEGYEISDIIVDSGSIGVSQPLGEVYTFTNVTANHTIEAQFSAATLPGVSLDKTYYDRGYTVRITLSGGTPNEPVMLQINKTASVINLVDQKNFASDGSLVYEFKIPASWARSLKYKVYVKDITTGARKTVTLKVKDLTPLPPRRDPRPAPPPVNKAPVADAGPDQTALVGRAVYFNGSGSSDSDGTISQYWWFADIGAEEGVAASFVFESAGVYNVTHTVIDNLGGVGSDITTITVVELPLEPDEGVDEGVDADVTDYVVDAVEETGASVKVNTTDQVTVSILQYPENPYPGVETPENSLPTIVDIFVSNHDSVTWPIYVERHYADSDVEGLDESRLALYYYEAGEWQICRETGVYPALNVVWANMYEDEVLGSPVLIAPRPWLAAFVVSNMVITPSEVEPEENVTISVDVTNVGGEDGNYTVELMVGEAVEEEITVEVGVNSTETVTFTVTRSTDGIYSVEAEGLTGSFTVRTLAPASFEFMELELSSKSVEPDEEVDVSVILINIGEKSGTYTVEGRFDGAIVYNESKTLDGGVSTTIQFSVSADEDGSYTVEIDGLSDTFTVTTPLTPAEFEYTIVSVSPRIAEPDEDVTVDVEVKNVGEESGTYEYTLTMDGVTVETSSGQLAGGDEVLESFTVSSETDGSYTLEVDGDTDTFTVITPEPEKKPFPWLWVDAIIIVVAAAALYYLRQKKII